MSSRTRVVITVVVALAILGIIVTAGINVYQNTNRPPVVVTLPPGVPPNTPPVASSLPVQDSAAAQPLSGGLIYVHVAGAVRDPNLYKLPNGDRVFDAIKEAGGAVSAADLDAVNLAEPVHDGEKIYVPTKAEIASSGDSTGAGNSIGLESSTPSPQMASTGKRSGSSSGQIDKFKMPGDGSVDINTASSDELQRIPGVGPAMAEKILMFRQTYREFRTPNDLREIPGVGEKKFAKMRPFVHV